MVVSELASLFRHDAFRALRAQLVAVRSEQLLARLEEAQGLDHATEWKRPASIWARTRSFTSSVQESENGMVQGLSR
jgi:hypothetical protein